MNLKLHLLIRMTLLGLLCWLGFSVYVVVESGRQASREIAAGADQLQPMLELDVRRRLASAEADWAYPDLGWAASRFPMPVCLRYRASDGSTSQQGCGQDSAARLPRWLLRALTVLGTDPLPQRREIAVWNRPVGVLEVVPDQARLLESQWHSVRDLLGLSALTLLALGGLSFWVIGRALRPTAAILSAVERLGQGAEDLRLPPYRPREFGLIAGGINRLAERLAQSSAARAELTARLIRLQESERRELAHALHEEFGQCVAALGAVSASLRHSVLAGEPLGEADVAPLEAGVEQMLASLRGLLQRLSQPPLEQQGLLSALNDLVTAWQIRLRGAPRIVLDAEPGAAELPGDERALCVYRVVQECLSNIARHAPGSRNACVRIRRQARLLSVRVSNDRGAAEAPGAAGTGMGLKLLDERVRALQGTLSVEAGAAEFAVLATLPLPRP
jgi:signal transduction histidine kinase